MPSLVYVQGGRAECREHGDVGPVEVLQEHIQTAHPWINDPDPEEHAYAWVFMRRALCSDAEHGWVGPQRETYEEAAEDARQHSLLHPRDEESDAKV